MYLPQGAESYRGGVWSPTDCNLGIVNAAVLVVGYGTGTSNTYRVKSFNFGWYSAGVPSQGDVPP